MEFSIGHLAIMTVTICLVLGSGLCAARLVHSSEGFSLGGRSAGVPMIAGSIAGTCVGGGATIGTAQLAGSVGLSAVWFTIGVGLSLLVMGLIYARPLRYTGLETVSQYIVGNYGKGQAGSPAAPLPLAYCSAQYPAFYPGLACWLP